MAKFIDTFRDLPHKFHLPSGGKAKASDKQLKQFKEFFDIRQCCSLGFPDNASAVGYDSRLSLLAIGTKTGEIFICGAPGVVFNARHPDEAAVTRVAFLPNEGRLISVTSDNKLHKWELNGADNQHWHLDHAAQLQAGEAEEEGERVTALGIVDDNAWIGYDNGKVKVVDVKEFKFTELETSSDAISKSLPEEARAQVKGWSSVADIQASPAVGAKRQIAVGYLGGPVALLNSEAAVEAVAVSSVELECLAWQRDGGVLLTGHSDGSHCSWTAQTEEGSVTILKERDSSQTVYGPFPCNGITKLVSKTAKLGTLLAFAGGLAKNTHSGRHGVTVIREQEHVCFDLASPVIDLAVLCSNGDGDEAEYDEPHSLIIVCESELVAIDLVEPNWPCYRLPYLASLQHSPVTVARLFSSVSEGLRSGLLDADETRQPAFSKRDWPITGGRSLAPEADESAKAELLVTGHADGGVAFWRLEGPTVTRLRSLDTARLFEREMINGDSEEVGDFSPFRAVGQRRLATAGEPDARLSVTAVDIVGDQLVVCGAAGQAVVYSLTTESKEVEIDVHKVNADIVSTKEAYEWEGPAALKVREESLTFEPPYQLASVVLLHPPAPVTAVEFSERWNLLALGTAHGLAIVDTQANKCLAVHCTLPQTPTAAEASPQQASTGGSNLTKSLRQSFRRLKKLRGGKKQEYTVNTEEAKEEKKDEKKEEKKEEKKKDKKKDKKEKKKDEEKKEEEKKEEEKEEEKKEEDAAEKKEEAKEEEEKKEEAPTAAAEEEAEKEEKKEEEKPAAEEAKEAEPAKEEEEEAAKAEGGAEEAKEEGAAAAAVASESAESAAAPTPQKLNSDPTVNQVRCLTFASAHLASPSSAAPSLFAGDNSGRVYAFQLTLDNEDRKAELSKELHLRHGAPVVSVMVIGAGRSHAVVTDADAEAGPQELLVVSEEQVKLFSLPGLKPRCKARLTGQSSQQQQRVRASSYGQFESSQRADASEFGVAVCANNGDILVLSVPHLRVHAVHHSAAPCDPARPVSFSNRAGGTNPMALRANRSGLISVLCLSAKACRYAVEAAVELEEGMRPTQAPPAAEATAAPPAEEAKQEQEQQEEGKEAPADLDKSGNPPVAADITMDDIKEYATGAAPPPTETIPETSEDKRESTVSADEKPAETDKAEKAGDNAKEVKAPETAEVKVSADVIAPPAVEVTAGDASEE